MEQIEQEEKKGNGAFVGSIIIIIILIIGGIYIWQAEIKKVLEKKEITNPPIETETIIIPQENTIIK